MGGGGGGGGGSQPMVSVCFPKWLKLQPRRPTSNVAYCRDEEEVEGKEGEGVDMGVLLETVQLHARVVVDVEVALLGHSEHHLIVEKPGGREGRRGGEGERKKERIPKSQQFTINSWTLGGVHSLHISDCLPDMELAAKFLQSPVHRSYVTPPPSQQQVPVEASGGRVTHQGVCVCVCCVCL